MLVSLFQTVGSNVFPVELFNDAVSTQLMQVFHEIPMHYGNKATVGIKLSMATGEGKPINFDMKNGVQIGSQNDITTTLELICSNATTVNETAVVFSMNLEAFANITMQNFVIWPKINKVFVANTQVSQDNIGMMAHNYNVLFTSILMNAANDMNIKFQKGWPMANIDPAFALIGGLIKNATISPYISENFLYAGFSMQADMPTLEFI